MTTTLYNWDSRIEHPRWASITHCLSSGRAGLDRATRHGVAAVRIAVQHQSIVSHNIDRVEVYKSSVAPMDTTELIIIESLEYELVEHVKTRILAIFIDETYHL